MNILSEDRADTERWARRALEIATQVEAPDTIASAVGMLGAAAALQGLESGVEGLERSLALVHALPHGEDLVGRTHVFLCMAGCRDDRSI
jgi:hypothetical protein